MKKTLIINGSPRTNGNTRFMIDLLSKKIIGKNNVVDAYYLNISPCVDCRRCRITEGCAIKDGMTEIYDCINGCDNIIIASPVYFGELTPPILSIGSRLQTYYCSSHFLHKEQILNHKKGGIILTGGGNGSGDNAVKTAGILLKQMGVKTVYNPVFSLNTDKAPSSEDEEAITNVCKLADFLNNT